MEFVTIPNKPVRFYPAVSSNIAIGNPFQPKVLSVKSSTPSGKPSIAIEAMAIEIVDLPMKHGDFPLC